MEPVFGGLVLLRRQTPLTRRLLVYFASGAYKRNPAVPAELERIFNKCLENDRSQRYQNAAELLADLRTLEARRCDHGTAVCFRLPSVRLPGMRK